jgi:hypothetical protein
VILPEAEESVLLGSAMLAACASGHFETVEVRKFSLFCFCACASLCVCVCVCVCVCACACVCVYLCVLCVCVCAHYCFIHCKILFSS